MLNRGKPPVDIEKALEIFNENPDLATFVLDQGGQRIELSRFSPNQSTASKSEAVCLNTEKSVDLAEESLTGHQVCSPMVGTLYLSPSPGEQTYVKPGDLVKEGDVLCLIEAMKMFNKIKADKPGYVRQVLVSNESPVEFNQPIVIIDDA